MPKDPERVQRIKEQIRRLNDKQHEAFKRAIYIPMTPDEVKACDQRRTEIGRLTEELVQLYSG